MHETGLISKWQKKWFSLSATCSAKKVTNTTLDMYHFVGLFILYGIFIAVSLVVLCGEYWYATWKKAKDKNEQNYRSEEFIEINVIY